MFAVIFRARIKQLDSEYSELAERLRRLAIEEFGCIDFIAMTEDNRELAISYWHSEEDIHRWKQAAEHLHAQANGKQKWYESYEVQIARICRTYGSRE